MPDDHRREAWERGQELSVHGWIYGLEHGLLTDLNVTVTNFGELTGIYEQAIDTLTK
jgi:carbonic anhydrase